MRQSRKTLSLTVMPDMRLLVKVPQNADERRIELFLQKKWLWLGKQMAYFKRYKQKKIYTGICFWRKCSIPG